MTTMTVITSGGYYVPGITFTGSVAGATSGTLTGAVTNGTYTATFSDGEVRQVTITGGTACAWSGALSTLSGSITTAQITPPNGIVAGSCSDSAYTWVAPADFYKSSSSTDSRNTLWGTTGQPSVKNLFAGSLVVLAAYFGMSSHNQPTLNQATDWGVTAQTVRTHDYTGGDSTWRARWSRIEPTAPSGGQGIADYTQHTYNFALLDEFVTFHHDLRGRDVIHTLFATPNWASARPTDVGAYSGGPNNCDNGSCAEPASMNDWIAYCTACATRYKGRVKYYEIWNEPNITGSGHQFFSGTQTVLAQMVRIANQTITAIDPSALIISPPVTNLSTGASQSGNTYFTGMMAASDGASGTMANWVNIIGAHLYPVDYTHLATVATDIMVNIRASMATAGVSGLPLWNTEYGILSPNFSTLAQAARINAIWRMLVLPLANATPCARTVFYALDDGVSGFTGQDATWWNFFVNLLTGATITAINVLWDGRVAVSLASGSNYIW